MSECIAVIRGINVGRNKRLAMADLRDLMLDLGHTNVRTLLNSGNVLFRKSPSARLTCGVRPAYLTANSSKHFPVRLARRNWATVLKLQAAAKEAT